MVSHIPSPSKTPARHEGTLPVSPQQAVGASLTPWGAELRLTDVDVAQWFSLMIGRRKTLKVTVTSRGEEGRWVLSFSEGELKGVRARFPDEGLLTQLLAQGTLTSEQVDRAQRRPARDDLIEWLIERELASPRDLRAASHTVATRHLSHIFTLTDGQVSFEPYERPEEPLNLPLSALRLTIQGVYRGYDRLRLYERFGSLRSIPVARPAGLFRGDLTEVERGLLAGAQGRQSVGELAAEVGADPLFALSFFYVMSLLSEVRLEARSPLGELYERAMSSDYLQLLGVTAAATPEEVAEAWRKLRAKVAEVGGERTEEGREVIEVLKDAHLVLTHPHLRARYLEAAARPPRLEALSEGEHQFTTPARPLALGLYGAPAQPGGAR